MIIRKYEEIKIGDAAKYKRTITEDDIEKFAEVSGDYNPVHMNEEFAKNTLFEGRIAHGMLSASFISTVLAQELPGPGSIYLSQNLIFKKPVRIGDTIITRVQVFQKLDDKKRIRLKTTCTNQDGTTVIEGEALVMVPT
ncbi:MAG: MaoC family dehydratase [Candidatus Hodarchaeota archaeon]